MSTRLETSFWRQGLALVNGAHHATVSLLATKGAPGKLPRQQADGMPVRGSPLRWMLTLLDQLDAYSQLDTPILSITNTDFGSRLSDKSLYCPVRTNYLSVIVVIEHCFLLIGTSDGNQSGILVHIEKLAVDDFFSDDFLILRTDEA
jgi:hypothetical protein